MEHSLILSTITSCYVLVANMWKEREKCLIKSNEIRITYFLVKEKIIFTKITIWEFDNMLPHNVEEHMYERKLPCCFANLGNKAILLKTRPDEWNYWPPHFINIVGYRQVNIHVTTSCCWLCMGIHLNDNLFCILVSRTKYTSYSTG